MMLVYVYSKCSTCQKALSFLKQNGFVFEQREITLQPPSTFELEKMLQFAGGNIKKLFNTSGLLYKEMQLSEKLKNMTLAEALDLLSQHGMLVKRPFVLGEDFGFLGFKPELFEKKD